MRKESRALRSGASCEFSVADGIRDLCALLRIVGVYEGQVQSGQSQLFWRRGVGRNCSMMLQTLGFDTSTNLLKNSKSVFVFLLSAEGRKKIGIDVSYLGELVALHVLSWSVRKHCVNERSTFAV
jgi:hypothetical protein